MKREMLEVVNAFPPNIADIVKVLPDALTPGVMFAYQDKVYFPGGKGPLTRELDAHERVHLERQKQIGTTEWWRDYLENPKFRLYEEALAHGAEYKTYCKRHLCQVKRSQFLNKLAKRLASSLYGESTTVEQAKLMIRAEAV